jgi:soluble lytic murein transglycosylase-like protein
MSEKIKSKSQIFLLIILLFFISTEISASEFFYSEKEKKDFENNFLIIYAQIGKYYENIISYYNPRLSKREVEEISRSIIFYSMLFSYKLGIEVDPRLIVAIIVAESNFNPKAVSNKGALGLGQLMPFKAEELGIENVVFHPVYNIYGTVRTFAGLLKRWENLGNPYQTYFAIASYNAGIGAVKKYGGIPPYKETQNYITKVLTIYSQIAPDGYYKVIYGR